MPKLVTTWFGTFLVERGKVVKQVLFPKDAKAIAERLKARSEDKVLDEERAISVNVRELKVSEGRLSPLGPVSKSLHDMEVSMRPEIYGFSKNLYQEAMLVLGRSRMKEIAEDRYIIQAVKAIDDLNKTANLLSERLHEWYSLHYPELGPDVADEKFAQLIAQYGERTEVAKEGGLPDVSASVGAPLGDQDKAAVMAYAGALENIFRTRGDIEAYIEERMKEVAPNSSHLIGPILAAKLIALAGGLERLARLPSSTVQMLGAEKAFFRHITEGQDLPKHGVIFQHPLIHGSPFWQRGKIARAMAAKISIAAKTDAFSDNFNGEAIKTALDKRVEAIRQNFKAQPAKGPRRMGPPQRDGRRGRGYRGHGHQQHGHEHFPRDQGRSRPPKRFHTH
jgi:nucleolar protein 56